MSRTITGTPFIYSLLQDRSNQYYSWSSCLQGSVGCCNRRNARSCFGWSRSSKRICKYAVSLYKKDILVGYIPIEISSLSFHFINQDAVNKIKALTTGKRQREIGLVVLAKLIFVTNNKRFSEVLENELVKRKNKFSTLTLKFKKKGVYHKFPFYLIKYFLK